MKLSILGIFEAESPHRTGAGEPNIPRTAQPDTIAPRHTVRGGSTPRHTGTEPPELTVELLTTYHDH